MLPVSLPPCLTECLRPHTELFLLLLCLRLAHEKKRGYPHTHRARELSLSMMIMMMVMVQPGSGAGWYFVFFNNNSKFFPIFFSIFVAFINNTNVRWCSRASPPLLSFCAHSVRWRAPRTAQALAVAPWDRRTERWASAPGPSLRTQRKVRNTRARTYEMTECTWHQHGYTQAARDGFSHGFTNSRCSCWM